MEKDAKLEMVIECYSDGTILPVGIVDGKRVELTEANARCEDLKEAEMKGVLFKRNPWCWLSGGRLVCWP